ncbi:MAG: Leader peptidase (Prepilin peptidase) / N-methyltransferase [Firmicutes bacterium]|nr:Leader peptidase (Prepilin peptidase) / N-methyltransferase [Bacillota bacterium]
MQYTIVFIIGLIVGSFLNVCICRIPGGLSITYPPSRCTECGKRLKWYHMIPVASFVFLGGRCAYCRERISPVYPAVELITAVLYTAAFHRLGAGVLFIKSAVLFSLLIVITFIDLKEQIIPDSLIVFGLAAGIVFTIIDGSHSFKDAVLGFAIGGGLLLTIVLLSRGGMGGGDVKFMAVIGLFLGWRLTLVTLFISFVTGGITGILLLLTGKKGRKDPVPFGPFIGISAVAAVLCGQTLISLYLNLY